MGGCRCKQNVAAADMDDVEALTRGFDEEISKLRCKVGQAEGWLLQVLACWSWW